MNEAETTVAEFSPEVIKAEAERMELNLPASPEAAPEEAVQAEAAPEFTADFSGFDGVGDAAAHAEAIMNATPEPVETVEVVETPEVAEALEGFSMPEVVPAEPVQEEAVRPESHLDELEEGRDEAREEARRKAAEEASERYADLREEELAVEEAASHEQWSEDQLEEKLDELREEYAA